MPRAEPKYHSPTTGAAPVHFDRETRARLKKICGDPAFTDWIEFLASQFRNELRADEPSDAAVLATLAQLQRRTRALHRRLATLPVRVSALLEVASAEVGAIESLPGVTASLPIDLQRLLRALEIAIARAQHGRKGRPGPRKKNVERLAVDYVKNAFKMHGLEFRLADDRLPAKENDAAFCIRLVLHLRGRHRVEHLLSSK